MSHNPEHHHHDRKDLRFGVITVSSSRAAAAKEGKEVRDASGDGRVP